MEYRKYFYIEAKNALGQNVIIETYTKGENKALIFEHTHPKVPSINTKSSAVNSA